MSLQMGPLYKNFGTPEPSKKTRILIGSIMITSLAIVIVLLIKFVFLKYDWLNVHLVPHTHDDVGWLRTPEDYYKNYVKYILDHVVRELKNDKRKRFVYVETYFFWKWWEEQSLEMRQVVQKLIDEKQLEIIGGGWCMSDEAVTHYQSFIDQSTWGFRRLNDTFGPSACPTVAWQIDTFGHSMGIASLMAQMGFNSLFFARIDVDQRKQLKVDKEMEFVWRTNNNLGESSSIFTSIFLDHYSAPQGFDFETMPVQNKIDYSAFSQYVRHQAQYFKTDHVLVPMGDDFRYFNAKKYFHKLDELIEFFDINTDFKLKVFYSTPGQYIKSLSKVKTKWPEKHGDFFPYASEHHAYWTGYFTSRPTLKYFARISNNILQVSKQLLVFAHKGVEFFNELTTLREAVGVLQHHDAITGTSQQHVTDHYVELLYEGIDSCENPVSEALGKLSSVNNNVPRPMYESCLMLNISQCEVTEEAKRFVVTVYNSLSRIVDYYVRIPVTGISYTVLSSGNVEIRNQMVVIPKTVRNIPGRRSKAKMELVFKATGVPAMGFKSFFVVEDEQNRNVRKSRKFFGKKNTKLIFDRNTSLLSGIVSENLNISFNQSIRYYKSNHHWSGAYVFRPAEDFTCGPEKIVTLPSPSNGDLVREYEQIFSEWTSQIITVYNDEDVIEFNWLVGPIPINDYIGKEVILQYQSDINNDGVFYTDVNGMEMKQRVKDWRSWGKKITEPVAGNYYPVTSMISIKDNLNQMFIINDRAQGGSSLRNGEIELMVHRRLCYDDAKGVDEALNETAYGCGLVARGRHWLMFGKSEPELEQKAKLYAQMRHSEPWLFFFDASLISYEYWSSNYVTEFSGLNNCVPSNVRILTLEPWREDTVLLRLEHIFDKLPNSDFADDLVLVSLQDLFTNFEIVEARETTLGADRWLSESKRLKWKTSSRKYKKTEPENFDLAENITISLKPQEIRTFIVTIKAKK